MTGPLRLWPETCVESRKLSHMSSIGVSIPALDPPWPDDAVIMVVTSRAAPGWRSLAHQAALLLSPGATPFRYGVQLPGAGEAKTAKQLFLPSRGSGGGLPVPGQQDRHRLPGSVVRIPARD